MFIAPAKTINPILEGLDLANSYEETHKNSRDFYVSNRNAMPKHEHILEALESIKENLGIILTTEQLEVILSLFPAARINLAVYEKCSDTEVEGLIIDAVYSFITGCEFPLIKDSASINMDSAFNYLHSQAKEMGYLIHSKRVQTN